MVEYADVVMLVAARRDQLTMNTLRERYLLPLADLHNALTLEELGCLSVPSHSHP